MRRPMVAGNWKMHGSRAENARAHRGAAGRGVRRSRRPLCVICPPFVYLQEAARLLRDCGTAAWAPRTSAPRAQGAFTGEVSAAMLKDVGCRYVIVGHSERRALYGESDQLVARKFGAAQRQGLMPILCVGEQLAEREAGRTQEVVARQLDAVLELCGVGGLGAGGGRLRAGLGDRHRQDRDARAGAGSARLHPRPDRGPGC